MNVTLNIGRNACPSDVYSPYQGDGSDVVWYDLSVTFIFYFNHLVGSILFLFDCPLYLEFDVDVVL